MRAELSSTYGEVMFTRPVELTCSPVYAGAFSYTSRATLSELAQALFSVMMSFLGRSGLGRQADC